MRRPRRRRRCREISYHRLRIYRVYLFVFFARLFLLSSSRFHSVVLFAALVLTIVRFHHIQLFRFYGCF